MEFQHEKERIFALDESGKLIAEVTCPTRDGGATIDHTFVDDSLRGQGVAGQLLRAATEQLRADGVQIRPTCSYAVRWFGEHPENGDLLLGRD